MQKLSSLELETFLNIIFASDGDYIFQAEILKAICPNGW